MLDWSKHPMEHDKPKEHNNSCCFSILLEFCSSFHFREFPKTGFYGWSITCILQYNTVKQFLKKHARYFENTFFTNCHFSAKMVYQRNVKEIYHVYTKVMIYKCAAFDVYFSPWEGGGFGERLWWFCLEVRVSLLPWLFWSPVSWYQEDVTHDELSVKVSSVTQELRRDCRDLRSASEGSFWFLTLIC